MSDKMVIPTLNIFYGYRCNYSCEDCCSGSDIIDDGEFDPPFEEVLASMPLLAEKFDVEVMITLMGGEPWLYWDDRIVPLVFAIDKHFPNTKINIFSNGHLLGKNIQRFIDLTKQIPEISLTISRHLDYVLDSPQAKIWRKSYELTATHEDIVKIHEDHFHVKDNIKANIHFNRITSWNLSYIRDAQKQIKPFATKDPAASFKARCGSFGCTCTFGTKLYKCTSLGILRPSLAAYGQLEDPDWQPYLNYEPVDLESKDRSSFEHFRDTFNQDVPQCDMCNDNNSRVISGRSRTLKMIFQKNIKHSLDVR